MKILLPIDGSELSLHEVRFAMRLVREGLRANFLLVNVQDPATLYEIVTAPDPAVLESVSQAAGSHVLQPAMTLLEQSGIDCETAVMTGDPAHAVLELIEQHGCEMVIMGTRAQGLLRSALTGSVAQTLMHDAPVPVLLVKPPPEDDEAGAPV